MISAARTVEQGDTISLYIEVRDIEGILVDSDTTPVISIFDFDSDPRSLTTTDTEAVILNDVSAVKVAQGVYRFDYTVPLDAHVGVWFDRWVITIDGVVSTAVFQFQVNASASTTDPSSTEAGTNALLPNNVIIVTLDENIAATDGTFLPEDFQYYFTTKYDPLYSTIRKIRLRGGQYMKSIPDDTINLAIFEASIEADILTFGMRYPPGGTSPLGLRYGYTIGSGQINPTFFTRQSGRSGRYYQHAREEYTTCMALFYILSNSLGPTAKSKKLADFSVEYGDQALKDFMIDLRNECLEWESVLQSGGYVTKGASLPSRVAQRGVSDPDAPNHGRRALESNRYPAANTKVQYPNRRSRWKHTFK